MFYFNIISKVFLGSHSLRYLILTYASGWPSYSFINHHPSINTFPQSWVRGYRIVKTSVWTSGFQWGLVLLPEDRWQCLKTILTVTTRGGGCRCYGRLTGGGQAHLQTPGNTEDGPLQQKILWLEIVTVLRLRYPTLDQHTCTATQWTCSWYSSLRVSPRECLVTL